MTPLDLDPEIINGFKAESNQLLQELTEAVDKLEDSALGEEFPSTLLEEFSQKVDRIMGAAKTISMMAPGHEGLVRIGKLSEVCKHVGYKAAERKEVLLLPLFAAFWSDVIEVIQNLLNVLEDDAKTAQISQQFSPVLQKRLEWLASKLKPQA